MNRCTGLYALPLSLCLAACASSTPPKQAASAPATAASAASAATEGVVAKAALQTPPPRKDDADRKSKNGRLDAKLGGAKVIVQYGRPEVRGRPIFGELVPYGAVWRTGANEATTFTVDKAIMVEGKALAAGTYSLLTVPTETSWTIVFNSVPGTWGTNGYNASKDVLRVDVTASVGEMTEVMTFSAEGDVLTLSWDKTMVPIKISAGG